VLELKKVSTYYGKIRALWEVSFDIREREIVALVGANGSGKTTLLNTISGLLRTSSGEMNFVGRPIQKQGPASIVEAGISQVPQGGRLFPDMSVLENLEMGAYPLKAWRFRKETLETVYDIFPRLKERMKQMVRTLSGGEKQMVAIGRGLMSRPKLCMFDEPSYGLAPKAVQEIFRVIRRLPEQGITVLLIEQNVKQALELAHRACVLENGRLTLEGPCCDLIENDHVKKAYLGL
jgi:branched-chain amino acid transport system ATP-binding protein